jgi:hypothetical protein
VGVGAAILALRAFKFSLVLNVSTNSRITQLICEHNDPLDTPLTIFLHSTNTLTAIYNNLS